MAEKSIPHGWELNGTGADTGNTTYTFQGMLSPHVQDHMLDIKFFVNCKVMEIITLTCFIKYRDLIVLSITAILKI